MIRVEAVSKRFGTRLALRDVNLAIQAGEIFGLLGPNGAGKSTLISLLATLKRPDAGAIFIGGYHTVTERQAVCKQIGLVFQENNLDRELTARQNLRFQARLYRLNHIDDIVDAMLDKLGLAAHADRPVEKFSGGMRRRLIIGRTLLTRPRVLLLDEPTTGLDPEIRRGIWGLIQAVQKEGCTVVLTTHYVEEAEALCHRVAIMKEGQVVASGAADDLRYRYAQSSLENVLLAIHLGGSQ